MWVIIIKVLKNPIRTRNVRYWSFFYNMIADMSNNKKLNPIVTELLIWVRKINFAFLFITQSYLAVQKLLD